MASITSLTKLLLRHIGLLDGKTVHTFNDETISGTKNFSGALQAGGYPVEAVVESGDGYIRYASGIQICWGTNIVENASSRTFAFGKSFIQRPVPVCCYGDDVRYEDQNLAIDNWDKNALVVALSKGQYPVRINWFAIGHWK